MPSKRFKEALKLVDAKKAYPLAEAVQVLKKFPRAKFDETVDLAIKLNGERVRPRFLNFAQP